MDVELALKLLTPKEGSVMIGLDVQSANSIKGLLIQCWLKGEGELVWQPTLRQMGLLLRRLRPDVVLGCDAASMAEALYTAAHHAFAASPEQDPEDIARLRYQLRHALVHGCVDVVPEDDENADEETDPGL